MDSTLMLLNALEKCNYNEQQLLLGGMKTGSGGMDNGFTATSNPNAQLERGEGFEGLGSVRQWQDIWK